MASWRASTKRGVSLHLRRREISPVLGYVTGWGMVWIYLLNPLISIIWSVSRATSSSRNTLLVVGSPLCGLVDRLTVQGSSPRPRANIVMGAILVVVIVIFFVRRPHLC